MVPGDRLEHGQVHAGVGVADEDDPPLTADDAVPLARDPVGQRHGGRRPELGPGAGEQVERRVEPERVGAGPEVLHGARAEAGAPAGEDLVGDPGPGLLQVLLLSCCPLDDPDRGGDHDERRDARRAQRPGGPQPAGGGTEARRVLDDDLGRGGEGEGGAEHHDPLRVAQRRSDGERRQHDQGPVPQVRGVGQLAHRLDARAPEGSRGAERPRHITGEDHRQGTADGECGVPARERGPAVEREAGRDDQPETTPGQERAARVRRPHGGHPPARAQVGQATGGELPGVGEGGEVRGGRAPLRVPDRVGERHQADPADAGHQRPARVPAPTSGQPGGADEEERPPEVELLLDRERPVVLHGAGEVLGPEVVGRLGREAPVHDVGTRRRGLHGVLAPHRHRRPQDRPGQRDQEHDEGERQQPARPARPEPAERHASRVAVERVAEVPGDQVAGEHEEDVDPDVAARDRTRPQVEEDDGQHRDRPQRLDLGEEPWSRVRAHRVRTWPHTQHGRHRSGAPVRPMSVDRTDRLFPEPLGGPP